jgi:hypothetical protein
VDHSGVTYTLEKISEKTWEVEGMALGNVAITIYHETLDLTLMSGHIYSYKNYRHNKKQQLIFSLQLSFDRKKGFKLRALFMSCQKKAPLYLFELSCIKKTHTVHIHMYLQFAMSNPMQ